MKAFQLVKSETPAELRDVPVPEPGPGEVLVKVGGAGLCHSDLHLMHFPLPFELPFTIGHETAGWIEAVGAGVGHLKIGEPMIVHGAWGCGHCRRCRQDLEQYCEHALANGLSGSGLGRDGGMAEYLLVPAARHLVPLGDLDPRDAAPLDDAALTPYHAIKASMALLVPDATVVVIGVGGLGHMAIQILRALSSVQIIATDVDPSKLALAGEVGADHTLANTEDAAESIRELTHGTGAAFVLDFVGVDETLTLASQIVQPMAKIIVVGAGMGTLPFNFVAIPYECSIASTFWGNVTELREVVALAQSKRIAVHTEHFPIERAAEAYELLERGALRGRAVVTPHG